MRITMFTGTLGAGGAERALIVLASGLQQRGHLVTILTWINQKEVFYEIPDNVNHVKADMSENIVSTRWYNVVGHARRFLALRAAIKLTQPEIVISFQDGNNELFLISSIGESYKKFISCQNDMAEHKHYNKRWDHLRKAIYGWADKVVFLDTDQADRAQKNFPEWKCTGIPNPLLDIDATPDKQASEIIESLEKFPLKLVAMGRLAHQKGFDLLLSAFSEITKEFPNVGLVILGEGPLRKDLEDQADKLGLSDKVMMPGQIHNPHAVISICDVFVFSSRYEGQGLALVEAMACGVPAVSFDCPSGPAYIIHDHVDGMLVAPENTEELADAVSFLLGSEKIRKEQSKMALNVKEKYSNEEICKQWEMLF